MQGELSAALSAYEQVIQEHPEDAVAKNGRACVLVEMGRWDEALSGLANVVRWSPSEIGSVCTFAG